MKKTLAVSALLVVTLLLSACSVTISGPNVVRGSGNVTTETRSVSNFSGLVLSGLGDVTITQGQTESLSIEAENNILPEIKTTVSNGILNIGFTRDNIQTVVPTKSIKYNLSVKNLTSVQTSGAGSLQTTSLKSDNLTAKLTGAGSVKLTGLDVSSLTTDLSGAGSITVGGQATQQDINLSGLGSFNGGDLKSQKVVVALKGAGSATVWANESLNITISGAGSVNYYGSPTVTKNVTGLGTFKSLGNK